MLTLTRKTYQRTRIRFTAPDGTVTDCWLTLGASQNGRTHLMFQAPDSVVILREEVIETTPSPAVDNAT